MPVHTESGCYSSGAQSFILGKEDHLCSYLHLVVLSLGSSFKREELILRQLPDMNASSYHGSLVLLRSSMRYESKIVRLNSINP